MGRKLTLKDVRDVFREKILFFAAPRVPRTGKKQIQDSRQRISQMSEK